MQRLFLRPRPLFPNQNYDAKWCSSYEIKQINQTFCRKKIWLSTSIQYNKKQIFKQIFYSSRKQKHEHNLCIHVAAQHALLCLQSLNLWIDPCIHMPNIFSFLFSFGEQTWFPSSFEFIRVQPMEYTCMYFFLVRGSFMATKTEPAVSTVQVWCKRLWNLFLQPGVQEIYNNILLSTLLSLLVSARGKGERGWKKKEKKKLPR